MAITQHNERSPRKPLRLWPGVAIVAVQWLLWAVVPRIAGDQELFGMSLSMLGTIGAVAATLPLLFWWLFLSRAPWVERVLAIVLMIAAIVATEPVVHESIAGALFISAPAGLCLALVAWAAITQRWSNLSRRAALAAAIVAACVPWTLLRTDGLSLSAGDDYAWRWTATPEQRLLAQPGDDPKPIPPPAASVAAATDTGAAGSAAAPAPARSASAAPATAAAAGTEKTTAPPESAGAPAALAREARRAEWPGFRGPDRDGIVRGVRINTDWSAAPPALIWRRGVGPGWSSFAVRGDLLYTQEQRGEDEIVGAYRVSTGEPVWRHRDAARFWESMGGAGPRATPTLHQDRVYAFGATGVLNALDAATGALAWSRDVSTDTGQGIPDWGFSSSPLIVGDVVIVAAAGTLAGYDLATGQPRWRAPSYDNGYSSPHRARIDGVLQVLLLGGPGAISVAPADGKVLWEHRWMPGAIVQPALLPDGDILVNALVATGGVGTRRLSVKQAAGAWTIEERWTSNGLKPYFNDFVVHKGHAFGFDGAILSCIDLVDGRRKWKGGRYGNGQLVLLPEQDVLLVLSEDGELALVGAASDRFREIARVPALDGKTWNHPVLVGDVLLVRNGQEMAAFRLSLAPAATFD